MSINKIIYMLHLSFLFLAAILIESAFLVLPNNFTVRFNNLEYFDTPDINPPTTGHIIT